MNIRLIDDNDGLVEYYNDVDGYIQPASIGGGNGHYENTFLKIYAGRRKINYANHFANAASGYIECTEDWHLKTREVIELASIPINELLYPGGQWHYIEEFLLPLKEEDNGYDWIAIEVEKLNTPDCLRPYVLIDDVKIEENNCTQCDKCKANDGCIHLAFGNTFGGGNTVFKIINADNVSDITISILETNGQLIATHAYQNPPYEFELPTNDFGGLGGGTFVYDIVAENLCDIKRYSERFSLNTAYTKNISFTSSPRIDGLCCGRILQIKDEVINEDIHYKALYITVGPNVTITAETDVTFQSEQGIVWIPPFDIEQGAVVNTILDECNEEGFTGEEELNELSMLREHTENTTSNDNNKKNTKRLNFEVFPNPVDNEVNIYFPNMAISNRSIMIYSLEGKIVYTSNDIQNNLTRLDLSFLSKGIYFIKVVDAEVYAIKKIIVN